MSAETRPVTRLECEAARALLRRARKADAAGEFMKAAKLRLKAAQILAGTARPSA